MENKKDLEELYHSECIKLKAANILDRNISGHVFDFIFYGYSFLLLFFTVSLWMFNLLGITVHILIYIGLYSLVSFWVFLFWCLLSLFFIHVRDEMVKDKVIEPEILEKSFNEIHQLYLKKQNLDATLKIDVNDFWKEIDFDKPISVSVVEDLKNKLSNKVMEYERSLNIQKQQNLIRSLSSRIDN